MKLIPLLMIFTGALLIYSAKINEDPRNVIYKALGIKRRVTTSTGTGKKLPDITVPDRGYSNVPHDAWGRPLNYPANPPGTVTVSV